MKLVFLLVFLVTSMRIYAEETAEETTENVISETATENTTNEEATEEDRTTTVKETTREDTTTNEITAEERTTTTVKETTTGETTTKENARTTVSDTTTEEVLTTGRPTTISPEEEKKKCEEYIKQLLKNINQNCEKKLDPFELEEHKLSIKVPILISVAIAEVKLFSGTVTGLSKAIMKGSCTVREKDKKQIMSFTITFKEIQIVYKGSVKLIGMGPELRVEGDLIGFEMSGEMELTNDGKSSKISKLNVSRRGKLETKFKGLTSILSSVISTLSNAIGTAISSIFKSTYTTNTIEKTWKGCLQKEAENLRYRS